MWFKVFLFLLLATPSFAGLPPTRILDEGTDKGVALKFDCVGAGIVCSQSGITGTLTVSGGGSGDSVSIDGVAVTDPNFNSTGDVDFVDTANVVTGTVVSVRPAAENSIEALLDLQDLQGAVTDGQVPNTITIDLATTATTANAGDSATAFFSSGTIEDARLPTTLDGKNMTTSTATTPSADDNDTSLATTAYVQTEINAMGGRSLTAASGLMDADAELYTDTKCIFWENPVATDDFKSIWFAKQAATLTSIWAESDQTVTFMLQVDDGTPSDVDTVDLAPAAGTAEDTALNGDATMAAGDRLDMAVTSVANIPTWVSVCWTFTYDD